MHDIVNTVRSYLYKIPYYSDKVLWESIYQSCLLSLLSFITVPNDNYSVSVINKNISDCIVLYNLPNSMYDYILVLVNKLKKIISDDLNEIVHSNQVYHNIHLMPNQIFGSITNQQTDEDC